ncbi:MAG: thiamine-phosphate kinase [Armatimonadia bacterium]|nr:thiamine-phosphate kinase [Armatimonadia bacterium]
MGSIGDLGEDALIRRLAGILGEPSEPVTRGIGDDCAVLRLGDRHLLYATDTMVEGTHFLTEPESPLTDLEAAGWRLGASNLSDIAAMGGAPMAGVISTALPPEWPVAHVESVYGGLTEVAGRYGLALCGGDVVRTRGPVVLSLAVLGESSGPPALRTGARPGDLLAVTGSLGEAAAYLDAVQHGHTCPEALRRRALRPRPRLEWGQALRGHVTAMMDLSDGLATDLPRLAGASGVGVLVRQSDLPVSDELVTAVGHRQEAQRAALSGGEEYELLVAIAPTQLDAAQEAAPITVIGEVTDGPSGVCVRTCEGEVRSLDAFGGWRHFG